ncbi:uncharacterized protein KY384_005120 [Bacidia gigantensis]|uniref:uncharacterized protein n=1 Tax=Bacidia gigantensis TaxID=2732470 RepID=UPI001D05AA3A|nr:uncharacterized protein KY384_005120 [Bacidia gigantensis]KAG8529639.1 hypothetical protein KY384_005120 [Bacidia gigantensis]
MTRAANGPSPFFQCSQVASPDQLAILHLSRDNLIPQILRVNDDENEGYDEGKVTNTRFGSFPHSTLIGTPWGTQVRASAVDTGSRGRKAGGRGKNKKRKRDHSDTHEQGHSEIKEDGQNDVGDSKESTIEAITSIPKEQQAATEAQSGFVHLLAPTPENWTSSLPHRTQVVYTPDYSYVLHRVKARPGTRIIEAGAGSGSFTHAAARAVFSSHPTSASSDTDGKVFSYEFHHPRFIALQNEVSSHGLTDTVELTSRDVCADGFVPTSTPPSSLKATAIFLDLPAPWLALKHLTRDSPSSVLDPEAACHICTFSPCIEQVQRTISTMRSLGWLDIEMIDLSSRKIEVRRERVGMQELGLRKGLAHPASVEESLNVLREVETQTRKYHLVAKAAMDEGHPTPAKVSSKAARVDQNREDVAKRKLWVEGRVVTRSEPELKTHTSYLVFAVLPRGWGEEDERRAREQWATASVDEGVKGWKPGVSKKAKKKAEKAARRADATAGGQSIDDGGGSLEADMAAVKGEEDV